MRLVLNIGTHKTGSRALQHFLSANGEELSEYGSADLSSFERPHLRANERLIRDVLEYKRLRNEYILYSERKLERRIFALVDTRTSLNNNYKYLSPDERAALLATLEPSVERLRTEFTLPPFPMFNPRGGQGVLTAFSGTVARKETRNSIPLYAVQRQVGIRLERLLIWAASLTRRRLPFLSWLLDCARGRGIRRFLLKATSRFQ